MSDNPLCKIHNFGQSIWLDFIRRGMITSGELQTYIDEDGVRGVTANPSIFEKAITGSHDYDSAIAHEAIKGQSHREIYETIAIEDVRMAADVFRPLYDREKGADGYVSLEVSPYLAHDTAGTLAEARRFWQAVDRPNIFIKVPSTREGLPAIRQLIAEGINVNITLLFGLPRYREVAEAYISGLEERAAKGLPIDHIASVASFFLSRIDVLLDPVLDKMAKAGGAQAPLAKELEGKAAIASAKVAYQIYKEIFGSARFKKLAEKGVRSQRLLWASTSTKNPAYSDTMYVEPLIGPDTINTAPLETIDTYRDHGQPANRIEQNARESYDVLRKLGELGINIDQVTQQLEDEGVQKFETALDKLYAAIDSMSKQARASQAEIRQRLDLGLFGDGLPGRLRELQEEQAPTRFWNKDASLWGGDAGQQKQVAGSLGWQHVADEMTKRLPELYAWRDEVRAAGIRRAVLMGMGGSSLAPLVFATIFSPAANGLQVDVLDTTDPQTVRQIEQGAPLAETLFIVASKSGTTAEPQAFEGYFWHKLQGVKGKRAGENMAAITDPGSLLEQQARERGYRKTFLNFTDIGGRYSALSYFGLAPAALLGIDLRALLERAQRMAVACSAQVAAADNPGFVLGAAMAELARRGRNKVTFLMPDELAVFGLWLEQLLAESTGKQGKGLLPVAGEQVGQATAYGGDRLFVHYVLDGHPAEALGRNVDDLRRAGQPVITIRMADMLDLGGEFLRWEIATALAGKMLGINPFDQPNVQESKDNTNRLLEQVRETDRLEEPAPDLTVGALRVFGARGATSLTEVLRVFLAQARPGDYVALLAYLPDAPAVDAALQAMRQRMRDTLHLATTAGYGPRYLHSTGQLHKGGPNSGLFIELTAQPGADVPVPGQPYSFGTFMRAQALGDLQALHKHGRRALRIDLGANVEQALSQVEDALRQAVRQDTAP